MSAHRYSQTILFFCLMCLCTFTFATEDMYSFAEVNDAKRFANLTQQVRCLVCQNQTISDSNAPLANDLREKIYNMVLEKKSDDEIKMFLTKRYGDFILFQPPFTKVTFALWAFPFFAIAFAWILIRKIFKKR